MHILGHKKYLFLSFALLLSACTTYDASKVDEEKQQLITNSENFVSPTGDLALDTKGQYSVKDTPLKVADDAINGMPTYDITTIGATSYKIISTGGNTGRSLYMLSPSDQFYALGTSDPIINSPAQLGKTLFAGKFTEMPIADGVLGDQTSGTIVLNLDPSAGTLASVSGPTKPLTYEWNASQGKFVGTGQTIGETIGATNGEILGVYKFDDTSSQTYGSYWGVGQ